MDSYDRGNYLPFTRALIGYTPYCKGFAVVPVYDIAHCEKILVEEYHWDESEVYAHLEYFAELGMVQMGWRPLLVDPFVA